jgi:hypothetical protein
MEGGPVRKRRRIAVHQDEAAICRLPEDLVLHVLSFLDVLSLVRCSRTCRQWNRLSSDWTLWQRVDLTPYKWQTKTLWKFVRQHCSDRLELLRLQGLVCEPSKLGKKKNALLTKSLVTKISSQCSNLTTLSLSQCDLQSIPLRLLPTRNLKALCLHNCLLSHGWFQVIAEIQGRKIVILPKINSLNLSYSTMIARDLVEVGYLTGLKHLDLTWCYRIDDYGLKSVCNNVKGLSSLNISHCTNITDGSMHNIGRCLKQLKVLIVSYLHCVTDMGITCIANGLSQLEVLDITGCSRVTDSAVLELANKLSELKEFNVSDCASLTKSCLETIQLLLPSCHFISSELC